MVASKVRYDNNSWVHERKVDPTLLIELPILSLNILNIILITRLNKLLNLVFHTYTTEYIPSDTFPHSPIISFYPRFRFWLVQVVLTILNSFLHLIRKFSAMKFIFKSLNDLLIISYRIFLLLLKFLLFLNLWLLFKEKVQFFKIKYRISLRVREEFNEVKDGYS